LDYPSLKTNNIVHHNFSLAYSNEMKFSTHRRYSLSTCCKKIQPKLVKFLLICTFPKKLYSQKYKVGPLGGNQSPKRVTKFKLLAELTKTKGFRRDVEKS